VVTCFQFQFDVFRFSLGNDGFVGACDELGSIRNLPVEFAFLGVVKDVKDGFFSHDS